MLGVDYGEGARTPQTNSARRVEKGSSQNYPARPTQGQRREQKSQDEAEGAVSLFPPPLYWRKRRPAKAFKDCLETTNVTYGNRRRPVSPSLDGPEGFQDVGAGVAESYSARKVMPYEGENDVADCEERTVRSPASCGPFKKFWIAVGIKSRNNLLARLYYRWNTRSISQIAPITNQYDIANTGLFERIEGCIFRIWYGALAWINVLKHECGFNGPRR
ncbi:MAG: hypothetical protein WB438_14220 [Candidatus Cybelea sp.]